MGNDIDYKNDDDAAQHQVLYRLLCCYPMMYTTNLYQHLKNITPPYITVAWLKYQMTPGGKTLQAAWRGADQLGSAGTKTLFAERRTLHRMWGFR